MPANDHDPEHWVNRPQTITAAGVAAVLLIGILIYAVMRTSDDSSGDRPDTFVPPSSSTPSSTWTPSSTSTTTYTTPSPQTSDANLPPSGPPTPQSPAPTSDEATSTETTTTPTTIYNPYSTTTTPNAGHV